MLGLVGIGAGDDLADVGVLRSRRPHLLPGDQPFVAVALGTGLHAGEIAAHSWFGEQLAGDDVATPQRPQVALSGHLGGVGEDRRGDHPQADQVGALIGHLVATLDGVVGGLVWLAESATAVLRGAGDPSEPGVEARLPERPGRGNHGVLFLAGPFLEHRHVVGALAPHELAVGVLGPGGGVEERTCGGGELVECGFGHSLRTVGGVHRPM